MALPSSGGHAACSLWVAETLVIERRFSTPTVCFQACCEQKPVGRNAQCGVMMGAAPPAALIMGEAKLLFEFLVIPLNGAAHHRRTHQGSTRHRGREMGKPVVHGLGFLLGPVDQQPLFLAGGTPMPVPVRRAHAQRGKARGEPRVRARPPGDRAPGTRRELTGHLFDGQRCVSGCPA